MSRITTLFVAILTTALLAACMRVQTQVTRFHNMPAVSSGETFAIVPYKEQVGSLEYEEYANLIARQLVSKGYIHVDHAVDAKYALFFAYAIDNGKTVTTEMPIFGQTGGGTATFMGNTAGTIGGTPYSSMSSGVVVSQPTYGQIGSVPVSTTVYGRALVVNILDIQKTSSAGTPVKVFEGTARSAGKSGNLATVMPNMIDAMFKDFPGKSGEPIVVRSPLNR